MKPLVVPITLRSFLCNEETLMLSEFMRITNHYKKSCTKPVIYIYNLRQWNSIESTRLKNPKKIRKIPAGAKIGEKSRSASQKDL